MKRLGMFTDCNLQCNSLGSAEHGIYKNIIKYIVTSLLISQSNLPFSRLWLLTSTKSEAPEIQTHRRTDFLFY